ncbi:MAG: Hsp20/alpha crystallin family protein [Synergistaceae bacterium]|jgi:HSP20 family protein|nr:Hsp20/alpha crystallin family protein [Synergistaceae bacterium]
MVRMRYLPSVFEGDPSPLLPSMLASMAKHDIWRQMLGAGDHDEGGLLVPRVDLYRKEGKVFVEAELPGVAPDDVNIHIYHDRISLSAEKKGEDKKEDGGYFRSERFYGKVERVMPFPVEVNPDSAKASFKHGVLTVEVAENTKPLDYKKVPVTSAE